MRRWALGALVSVIAAIAVPGASMAAASGPTRLRVAPAAPHPGSTVVISFREPLLDAAPSTTRVVQALRVIGPSRSGCISTGARTLAVAATGSGMRVAFRPGRMTGRRWCVAVYRVVLTATRQTACPVVHRLSVCPQYVFAPTVVATARFRVTRAG